MECENSSSLTCMCSHSIQWQHNRVLAFHYNAQLHTKDGKSNSEHKHNDGAKYAHQKVSSNKNGHDAQPWMLPLEFSQLDLMVWSGNECHECHDDCCEAQHHLNWMQNAATLRQQLNMIIISTASEVTILC